jgi:ferrous iron transport protein B
MATAIGVMASHFDGKLGAFAYLLAILLYSPCMSALSAYYRELSMRWMVFVAVYATVLGYSFGVLVYQVGRFSQHPAQSAAWIGAILTVLIGGAVGLALSGRRPAAPPPPAPQPAE